MVQVVGQASRLPPRACRLPPPRACRLPPPRACRLHCLLRGRDALLTGGTPAPLPEPLLFLTGRRIQMRPPRNKFFVLRFDDICPTMRWDVWSEIEACLVNFGVKPILAIVPDNRDPVLQVDPRVEDFWARARHWQELGWTIALHGYQHLYVARDGGLVTLRKKSEFASLPATEQEEKL